MSWDKKVGRQAGGVIEAVPEDALGLECYDYKICNSCWSVHFRSWILCLTSWILILKTGQDSTEKHGRSCSRLKGSPFKAERRMPLDFRWMQTLQDTAREEGALKTSIQGWVDNSGGEVFGMQGWGPEFRSPAHGETRAVKRFYNPWGGGQKRLV